MGLFKARQHNVLTLSHTDSRPGILLVDPEHQNLEVLSALLERYYSVHSVGSGEAALQWLASVHADTAATEKPRLLISCQRMLHMTGTELFSLAQKNWPDLRCILITGYMPAALSPEPAPETAFRLLYKPVESQQLLQVIAEELEKSLSAP